MQANERMWIWILQCSKSNAHIESRVSLSYSNMVRIYHFEDRYVTKTVFISNNLSLPCGGCSRPLTEVWYLPVVELFLLISEQFPTAFFSLSSYPWHIGPLLKKKIENQKIFFRKKGSSVFAFSVCLSVCLCVCVLAACRPQFLA